MAADLLLSILLIIAAVILLIILVLHLVPVDATLAAEVSKDTALMTASAVWGIVGARIYVGDGARRMDVLLAGHPVMKRDLGGVLEKKPEEEEERRPGSGIREYVDAVGDIWPHIGQVLRALLRSLSLQELTGEVTLGLESPAATGILFGYCSALRYSLWAVEPIDFRMTPVFDRRVLEGRLTVRVRIRRLLLIVVPVIAALMKRPVRERLRQISRRGVSGA